MAGNFVHLFIINDDFGPTYIYPSENLTTIVTPRKPYDETIKKARERVSTEAKYKVWFEDVLKTKYASWFEEDYEKYWNNNDTLDGILVIGNEEGTEEPENPGESEEPIGPEEETVTREYVQSSIQDAIKDLDLSSNTLVKELMSEISRLKRQLETTVSTSEEIKAWVDDNYYTKTQFATDTTEWIEKQTGDLTKWTEDNVCATQQWVENSSNPVKAQRKAQELQTSIEANAASIETNIGNISSNTEDIERLSTTVIPQAVEDIYAQVNSQIAEVNDQISETNQEINKVNRKLSGQNVEEQEAESTVAWMYFDERSYSGGRLVPEKSNGFGDYYIVNSPRVVPAAGGKVYISLYSFNIDSPITTITNEGNAFSRPFSYNNVACSEFIQGGKIETEFGRNPAGQTGYSVIVPATSNDESRYEAIFFEGKLNEKCTSFNYYDKNGSKVEVPDEGSVRLVYIIQQKGRAEESSGEGDSTIDAIWSNIVIIPGTGGSRPANTEYISRDMWNEVREIEKDKSDDAVSAYCMDNTRVFSNIEYSYLERQNPEKITSVKIYLVDKNKGWFCKWAKNEIGLEFDGIPKEEGIESAVFHGDKTFKIGNKEGDFETNNSVNERRSALLFYSDTFEKPQACALFIQNGCKHAVFDCMGYVHKQQHPSAKLSTPEDISSIPDSSWINSNGRHSLESDETTDYFPATGFNPEKAFEGYMNIYSDRPWKFSCIDVDITGLWVKKMSDTSWSDKLPQIPYTSLVKYGELDDIGGDEYIYPGVYNLREGVSSPYSSEENCFEAGSYNVKFTLRDKRGSLRFYEDGNGGIMNVWTVDRPDQVIQIKSFCYDDANEVISEEVETRTTHIVTRYVDSKTLETLYEESAPMKISTTFGSREDSFSSGEWITPEGNTWGDIVNIGGGSGYNTYTYNHSKCYTLKNQFKDKIEIKIKSDGDWYYKWDRNPQNIEFNGGSFEPEQVKSGDFTITITGYDKNESYSDVNESTLWLYSEKEDKPLYAIRFQQNIKRDIFIVGRGQLGTNTNTWPPPVGVLDYVSDLDQGTEPWGGIDGGTFENDMYIISTKSWKFSGIESRFKSVEVKKLDSSDWISIAKGEIKADPKETSEDFGVFNLDDSNNNFDSGIYTVKVGLFDWRDQLISQGEGKVPVLKKPYKEYSDSDPNETASTTWLRLSVKTNSWSEGDIGKASSIRIELNTTTNNNN